MPSIMAGINQVIMLSLSMVVIAGMVGAGGLGGAVVESLARVNVGLGFEAGLSVVIIAIFLDRITASFGAKKSPLRGLRRKSSTTPNGSPLVDSATGAAPIDAFGEPQRPTGESTPVGVPALQGSSNRD
jgi:glycine betaine/proline transport system substrate-binding protein